MDRLFCAASFKAAYNFFWEGIPTARSRSFWVIDQCQELDTVCTFAMADIGNKKRKRDGESSGKPKKKVIIDAPATTAAVSSFLRPKHCPPVIGNDDQLELSLNLC